MRTAERFDFARQALRRRALGPPVALGLAQPTDPELLGDVRRLELAWSRAAALGDEVTLRRLASEAEALVRAEGRNALVVMPAEILSEMETVNAIVLQLGRDVARTSVPPVFAEGWAAFASEWAQFFAEHQSWWSRTWGAVYEKTVEYRKRAASWRAELERQGGRPTGPKDAPPGEAKTAPDLRTVALYGGMALGGLVVLRALVLGR